MTVVVSEIYLAFLEAGASEEAATRAAEVKPRPTDPIEKLEGGLDTIECLVRANIMLTLLALGRLFLTH
jgi:hypothetical protein